MTYNETSSNGLGDMQRIQRVNHMTLNCDLETV